MPDQLLKPEYIRTQVERYRSQIPAQLWDILLPEGDDDLEVFVASIKRLRIKEQERNYVMAIQRKFQIPVRPHESVKESMARARAKIFSCRKGGSKRLSNRRLPLDPLE